MCAIDFIVEVESGEKQSIRVQCGPADGVLNRVDIDKGFDDGDDDDDDDDDDGASNTEAYDKVERMTTTSSRDEITESTERTVTSTSWKSLTSQAPASETAAAMTTGSVTSSPRNMISDYYSSSSTSVNVSCESLLN